MGVAAKLAPKNDEVACADVFAQASHVYAFRDFRSRTKRYLTSALTTRSQASASLSKVVISMSETMLCWPQKSSISCVCGIPPMAEPATLLRPMATENAATAMGESGMPTVQ